MLIPILIGCALLVGGVVYFSAMQAPDARVACTMEAKLCPDGSAVGRTGPNCEFAPCPEPAAPAAAAPAPEAKTTKTVKLYYYDPAKDGDATGNVMCSRAGLVPVEREVAADATPTDVVRMLIAGDLRPEDRAAGITTEYPLPGFTLVSGLLVDGTLTLTFDDQGGRSVGGSCRVGILWFQIDATAKQFPEVREVRFLPEEIFQP